MFIYRKRMLIHVLILISDFQSMSLYSHFLFLIVILHIDFIESLSLIAQNSQLHCH